MKIRHDIHTHNLFSACCHDPRATVPAFLQKEAELGIGLFGLSNHIWDERVKCPYKWYRHQTLAHAEEAKYAFRDAPSDMKVLFGAETDFFACRDLLGMSEEGAKRLDYLLVPQSHVHFRNYVMEDYPEIREVREAVLARLRESFPTMAESSLVTMAESLKEKDLEVLCEESRCDRQQYVADEMIRSFRMLMENETFLRITKLIPTVVAHPFGPVGFSGEERGEIVKRLDDGDLRECFMQAQRRGVAIELNLSSIYAITDDLDVNPLIHVFGIAKECGCSFTFGTDSHSVEKLEAILRADAVFDFLGLSEKDLAEFVRM